MKNIAQSATRHATHLVRGGRLLEATALIQRRLRLGAADSRTEADGNVDDGAVTMATNISKPPVGRDGTGTHERWPSTGFQMAVPTHRAQQIEAPSATTFVPAGFGSRHRVAEGDRGGGQFLTGSYTNDAGTRAYKVYIPRSYCGQCLPLVVMLHGCTQDPDDFAAGTRMNVLADEYEHFVVYPAQPMAANPSKCWNWFRATDQHRDHGEPSIIAGITHQIMRDYAIDPQRVYVAGLSAGGAMAAIMGVAYPELFAAVGVHSGLPPGAAHDLPSALAAMKGGPEHFGRPDGAIREPDHGVSAVPTIVFHGDRDTTVHPRNAEAAIAQCKAAGSNRPMRSGGPTDSRPTVQRGQVPDGYGYTRATYHAPNGVVTLEYWQVHGAGHAWSGGSPSGSYTDPGGPDAAREMIRFFQQQQRG